MRRSRPQPQLPPRPRSPSSAIPPPSSTGMVSEPVPYSPSRNPPSTLETSTSGIPPRRTSFRPIPETILPPTRLPRRSLEKEEIEKELPDVNPEIGFLIDIWTRTSDPTTFRVKLVIFNEETSTFDVYLEDPKNTQDPKNYILKIDNTGRKYFSNTKTPYYFSKFQIPFSLSPKSPRSIFQPLPKSPRSIPQPQSQRQPQPLPKYPPESETFQRPPFRLSPESPPKYQ